MRKTTWRADYWSWPERLAEHPLRADALSGDEFASFLLGHPSSGYVDRNINPAYHHHDVALFLQEDWKVTPRFTINAGLRWDYDTPVVERYNRMVRGFAFAR
jgi:outer membrane receptor protein involved in Fe transport